MNEIVGTIISVENFLQPEEQNLVVGKDIPNPKTITLASDRKYVIPDFQREIRWDVSQLKTLLSDLSRGPKFLGNIILTIKSGGKCELIDGQQRTTILMLIVTYIKHKYNGRVDTFSLCPLHNESFTGFQALLDVSFDESQLPEDERQNILDSDDFHQLERLKYLWNSIDTCGILSDRHSAKSLLLNLKNSSINIIASYSDSNDASIQYFLDVNLKGIRLDTEDIFKGYLFSQVPGDETKSLWRQNKQNLLRFNSIFKTNEKKKNYPLMKLYEHFFYCDLYLPQDGTSEYNGLRFGEDFRLTSEFTIGNTHFYEGNRLIEAISDCEYLSDSLERLDRCIKIMIDIVENEGPSVTFKSYFVCEKAGERIDSEDITNIHTMLKKILMEQEVIPKILALKYILSFLDSNPHSKKDYKSAYSIFCASVFFMILATKKESDTFYGLVRNEQWVNEVNKWVTDYPSEHSLTKGSLRAAYKYDGSNEDENDRLPQIRCKSLSAIYNFFRITQSGNNYTLKTTNASALKEYFTDTSTFSVEHLIIGEKGTLQIQTTNLDFLYKYPVQIKRYRNSIFNYIFIPKELNTPLGNKPLMEKLDVLKEHVDSLTAYSKDYLDALYSRDFFKKYPDAEALSHLCTQEEAQKFLDDYFTNYFPEEFYEFAGKVLKKLNLRN